MGKIDVSLFGAVCCINLFHDELIHEVSVAKLTFILTALYESLLICILSRPLGLFNCKSIILIFKESKISRAALHEFLQATLYFPKCTVISSPYVVVNQHRVICVYTIGI